MEVFPVRQATSIYQGYNQAMEQSGAKYKIYMHQDVFFGVSGYSFEILFRGCGLEIEAFQIYQYIFRVRKVWRAHAR